MRGKALFTLSTGIDTGITPAYAGKRSGHAAACADCTDHPRVCGEKGIHVILRIPVKGSPPRMRGKDLPACCFWACIGITPAYAGKRGRKERVQDENRDHPRVCGEKLGDLSEATANGGSPPRMRGKDAQVEKLPDYVGITPAYAGKSFLKSFLLYLPSGSPPRMRGKVCGALRRTPMLGITPAYAGKRVCRLVLGILFQDHPRVCGEKQICENREVIV